jgi:hydroxymethylpyrimidine kinase/phosphomethylpyrimidine kinase/thiamine-phosphate diphosphorylase
MTTRPLAQPITWSIAGSDPGSGAGIQADLKTMNALGTYGCTVIAALTAQNTQGVLLVEYPSPRMLQMQLDALAADLPPVAIKLGMLGPPESIRIVTKMLNRLQPFVVCDPVMLSTSGHSLTDTKSIESLILELLPYVDLLTPNLVEAETLVGHTIATPRDVEVAALELLAMGARSVLIKGGHHAGAFSQDYWTNGRQQAWLTSQRQDSKNTHGTGCTLSAAITACRALGYDELDAIVIAKAYINQGIRCAPQLGSGHGPMAHLGWPEHDDDMPWLTPSAGAGQERTQFPNCGEAPLGFYPIVNRVEWLEKLLPLGVNTIQLRIKDLHGEALEWEIAQAAALARQYECRLFVNDYWELAIKYDAYGVHLGQEDLETADLQAIQQAGLRLGVSTHSYAEVARALAVRPSYIAIGPVFPTTTKIMRFAPQGLDALRRWRRTLPYPLVAIAGIFLENAPDVLATGVDGIAVVRDIVNAEDIPAQVRRWLGLFSAHAAQQPMLHSISYTGTTTGPSQADNPPARLKTLS